MTAGMDFCDLKRWLRANFFAKDRDIWLQVNRSIFLGDGTEITPSSLVPIGGIIIWSGAIIDIPSGYQICDGTNGTPDLRDRFVIGAGNSYAVDDTGGSTTKDVSHTHGDGTYATANDAHTHDVAGTSANDSHSHGPGTLTTDSDAHTHGPGTLATGGPSSTETVQSGTGQTSAAAGHTHDVDSGLTASDSHSHTVNAGTTAGDTHSHGAGTYATDQDTHSHDVTGASGSGGSAVQDVLNPYYALAYIQRLT